MTKVCIVKFCNGIPLFKFNMKRTPLFPLQLIMTINKNQLDYIKGHELYSEETKQKKKIACIYYSVM